MKITQLLVRSNGMLVALREGRIIEQYRDTMGWAHWRELDSTGLEDARNRIVHITLRGDRVLAIDRDGNAWEQTTNGMLGAPYFFKQLAIELGAEPT